MVDLFEEESREKLKTKNSQDSLILSKSLSINEESIYLKLNYKIFKGFKKDRDGELALKSQYGKPDTKISEYNVFSVDRIFKNNFSGVEEMKDFTASMGTEEKIKEYFKL